ncbi:MAG: hypothetical protein IK007_07855 [Lachnospiraceae bacterium]|nr:hypothetical protein [Lachnospiraceae bacterium]
MKNLIEKNTILGKCSRVIFNKMKAKKVVLLVMLFPLLIGSIGVFDYKQAVAAEKPGTPVFTLQENMEEGIIVTIPYMPNVTGFRIYMLSNNDKNAGWKKYKKVTSLKQKGQKDTVYTIKLNNSEDYYIKVKAYIKVNGKTTWGTASKAKKINFFKLEKKNKDYIVDLNSAQRGDIVELGIYEQDNVTKDGKEPIEWIVLNVDKKENKAFLLSRYGLDAKDYNDKDTDVSWYNCSLRTWLNKDFYNNAFSDEEKKLILSTELENDKGNSTKDNVFLLSSYDVVYGYANKSEYYDCIPTKYAISNEVSHRSKTSPSTGSYCDYWLRSSGNISNTALYVQTSGGTNYKSVYHGFWYTLNNPPRNGDRVYTKYGAVRPAIYVKLAGDLEDIQDDIVEQVEKTTIDISKLKTGDIIQFGLYEQDNDISDGKEQIDWIVLSVDKTNNKVFVLSKYLLDKVEYYEGIRTCQDCDPYTNYTWDNSSIRKWLNNDFYNSAFNEEEKRKIIETSLTTPDSSVYGTEGGNDTIDKVFLLSFEEVTNPPYGFSSDRANKDIERRCRPTRYASARRVLTVSDGTKTLDKDKCNSGYWWLRSSGYSGSHVALVHPTGSVDTAWVCESGIGIRPAMWITIGD